MILILLLVLFYLFFLVKGGSVLQGTPTTNQFVFLGYTGAGLKTALAKEAI